MWHDFRRRTKADRYKSDGACRLALHVDRHPEERPKAASRRMIGPARAVALRGSLRERLRVTETSQCRVPGDEGMSRFGLLARGQRGGTIRPLLVTTTQRPSWRLISSTRPAPGSVVPGST